MEKSKDTRKEDVGDLRTKNGGIKEDSRTKLRDTTLRPPLLLKTKECSGPSGLKDVRDHLEKKKK